MRALTFLAAVVIVASAVVSPGVSAQQAAQPPAPAAKAAPTPAEIKQDIEKIKKARTLGIIPAVGTENGGATELRVDNTSAFNIVVLVVGPTTLRVELGPEGSQTIAIDPGAYELAVTVVGRNLPPFYGTQRILANMRYRHQFVIPAV